MVAESSKIGKTVVAAHVTGNLSLTTETSSGFLLRDGRGNLKLSITLKACQDSVGITEREIQIVAGNDIALWSPRTSRLLRMARSDTIAFVYEKRARAAFEKSSSSDGVQSTANTVLAMRNILSAIDWSRTRKTEIEMSNRAADMAFTILSGDLQRLHKQWEKVKS